MTRCDERLKTKTEGSTRLTHTGLLGELEHLKIKTRLIDETFASVMGECVIEDYFFVYYGLLYLCIYFQQYKKKGCRGLFFFLRFGNPRRKECRKELSENFI